MEKNYNTTWQRLTIYKTPKKTLVKDHGIHPLLTPHNHTINTNEDKINALASFFEKQNSLTTSKSDKETKYLIE